MARTQASGAEILDGSIAVVDLADDILPYIRQRSKPEDYVAPGDTLAILENKQHVVVGEMIVDDSIYLDGTLGIL